MKKNQLGFRSLRFSKVRRLFGGLSIFVAGNLLMTGGLSAQLLTDSLIHFTFDSAEYATGSGNIINRVGTENASIAGANVPNITGKIDQAAKFTSGRIIMDSNDMGNMDGESFSLSLWFNPASLSTTQTLVAKGRSSSVDPGWSLLLTATQLVFAATDTDKTAVQLGFNATMTTNAWYQVALVVDMDAQLLTTYFNGVSLGSEDLPDNLASFNALAPLALGASVSADRKNAYRSYTGGMDDFGLWGRTLSSAEVSQIYAMGMAGQPIPEPSTLALLGLISLAGLVRRQINSAHQR